MNIDIFIRTYQKDFYLLNYSLRSIIDNVYGFNNIIICVKEHEFDLLKLFLEQNNFIGDNIKIVTDINYDILYQQHTNPDYCGQQISKMLVDNWSNANYVMYVDSDIIFFNHVDVKDFFNDDNKIKYPVRLWEDTGTATIWKNCLDYLGITKKYEFMCTLPLIFPINIMKKCRNFIELKTNLPFVDACYYIYDNFGFSEFNIMGSILYEDSDVCFTNALELIEFNMTHFKQFWSYENSTILEKNINELLNLKYNFGFVSMLNRDDVAYIHHKYYSEDKIINYNTTNYEQNDNHNDYEKINVSGFVFFVHKNDTCIADCLKTGVLYEKFALSYLKKFIDPDKNILDIGSNIGTHTVIYSNYTRKTVYSFEPQKVLFDILNLNVAKNNCKNVITHNFGASNKNSNYNMNCDYSSKMNQGAFCIVDDDSTYQNKVVIECKQLDQLNITDVGYVKIDVEGHEFETLQGMLNILIENKPVLFIEIHDSVPTKRQSLELLYNVGYKRFYKLSHCDYIFTV